MVAGGRSACCSWDCHEEASGVLCLVQGSGKSLVQVWVQPGAAEQPSDCLGSWDITSPGPG